MTLQEACENALAQSATAEAIEYDGRWHTWGELRKVVDQVDALLDAARVPSNAAIGFVPRNRPSAIATELGLLARGRTIVMIYAFQSPAGIVRDLGKHRLDAVIMHREDLSPEVQEAIRATGQVGVILEGLAVEEASEARGRQPSPTSPQTDDPPHIKILTSGTTGPPKHVDFSYDLIFKHIVGADISQKAGSAGVQAPPPLLYFPLGNVSGVYSVLPPLLSGARAVLLDRFNVDGWLDYVRRHKPQSASMPPAGVRMVLDAKVPKAELAGIKVVVTGAAPLDPTVHRAFEDTYGIPILLSYGATEFGGPVTFMTPDLYARFGQKKLGSVGRPFAGSKLRIVDLESGEELPPDQEGLLEVISPRIGPDWIRTSDIARIDAEGFLWHCGRADGAIMRGGFKLLPDVIERALLVHDCIAAASVVGVKDERLGECPAAAIQLKSGSATPSISELEAHLRDRVYATHVPVKWAFVNELPRTPSFKIDLRGVKRLFEERDAAGER